jgi:hypothetical protein
MAENTQLDGFLAAGAQPAQDGAQPPEPQPAPEPPAKPETPPREPEKPAREAKAEPEAETEDEALAHVQGGDNRTVPFSALEKVRNDWKSKAAAEKAKADLLAQQLEEFKRQATAPAPSPQAAPLQQMPQPPDPRVDPVGAMQYLYTQQQHMLLNERLNNSEAFVRDKMGEDLDKYVAEFKDAAGKDQALWGKLYGQPAPYQWLVKEMDRRRAQADIGDDPTAYRTRIIAEERAKWEAELGQPSNGNGRTVTVSPAAGMAPSLANARSVAGRSVPAFTGPESFDDILRRPQRQQR